MSKKLFSTKNLAGVALFAALSFVVSFLEFPLFPAASFLKLDFSSTFTLLGGFMYGPVAAVMISAVKELLRLTVSSSGGVGELANFIVTVCFVIIPSVVYRYKKGIPSVIITLIFGTLAASGAAILCNRFLLFPLYMGESASAAFSSLWTYVLYFNLIKGAAVGVLVFVLYKRVSYLFKKINLQETKEDDIIKSEITEINTASPEETERAGFDYAKTLTSGDVVLLEGDLGAGKTQFVKGVAKYFGQNEVTSPTYSYLNVYGNLCHYDFYRLSSGEDAERLGLTDYFNGDNICLIEWGENIKEVLPLNCKKVKIQKVSDTERKIIL